MTIQITTKENQAEGHFLNGAILENKPIGFPQDGGGQKPISNIFYWANAWSEVGGTIPEHPHKFFEIMSFVLDGDIEHYDTKNKQWLPLKKGDVQIIRAGNGISHSEKMNAGANIFQIWFDPNIMLTQNKEASYSDYNANQFKVIDNGGFETTYYVGANGIVEMDTVVDIQKISFKQNTSYKFPKKEGYVFTAYVLGKEKVSLNAQNLSQHDFVVVDDEDELNIEAAIGAELFVIQTPKQVNYKLYNELVKF